MGLRLDRANEIICRGLAEAARAEGRREILALVAKLAETLGEQAAKGAHTYASENADHYRGFDAGLMHAKRQLESLATRPLTETGKEQA